MSQVFPIFGLIKTQIYALGINGLFLNATSFDIGKI